MTHLENVTADDLRRLLTEVEGTRPTQRIMLALNYKEGDITQSALAARYGISQGTVHNWLERLDRLDTESVEDVLYDEKRGPASGQPRELSESQYQQLLTAFQDSPQAVGYDQSGWTSDLAQQYIADAFDVEYCRRHARRLMSRAGLGWKTAQVSSTDPDEPVEQASNGDSRKRPRIWTTQS